MLYVDSLNWWHEKPCKNGVPSSNNGWVYSAMGKMLSRKFQMPLVSSMVEHSRFYGTAKMCLGRYPKKLNPVPISRDELIGMNVLKMLPVEMLIANKWLWCNLTYDSYGTLKGLWSLFKIRNEHRNYFWESGKHDDVFQFAFRVWWHDRFYYLKSNGLKYKMIDWLMFHIYAIFEIKFGTPGTRNVLWLQLKHLNSKFLIKFINQKDNFKKYFPSGHPFNIINM